MHVKIEYFIGFGGLIHYAFIDNDHTHPMIGDYEGEVINYEHGHINES